MNRKFFHLGRVHVGLVVTVMAGATATLTHTGTAAPSATSAASSGPATASGPAAPASMRTNVQVYNTDYPFMHYDDAPAHNQIVRLQESLASGKVKLTYGPQGYLNSLLAALDIDPDSQVMVFSKTSFQIDAINPETPRALYFNDDTYIGYVQNTGLMEVATMDSDLGAVFYSFHATTGPDPTSHSWQLTREAPRCLTCHDSYAESGGGVPIFMFESAYDLKDNDVVFGDAAHETTEQDPVESRLGGWYVTGDDGGAFHLGNVLPPSKLHSPEMHNSASVSRENARRGAVQSLDVFTNVTPYIRPTSDITALLVLQHEVDVHNAMVRANYKSRSLFAKNPQYNATADTHWKDMPPDLQKKLSALLEPVIRTMVMSDTAGLAAPVKGNSGFAAHFQARGPRDAQGRSLRDLDLQTRVFRYPMTFLVYSQAFDYLPVGVRDRLYARFADVLSGRDRSGSYAKLDPAACQAAFEILKNTKPDFARQLSN